MKRSIIKNSEIWLSGLCALAMISGVTLAQTPQPANGATPSIPAPHIMQGSTIPDTFSYAIWQGLIVVPVMFGDGMPEQAAICTGMPSSVILSDLASKKNLKTESLSDVVILDRTFRGSRIKPQLIRFDKFMIQDASFSICNVFSNISAQAPKDEPTVWIGTSALSATCMTIDPRKMEITLRAPMSQPPKGATKVPFVLTDGRIMVDVQVGKEKYQAVVDTGSATSLLPGAVGKKTNATVVTTADIIDNKGKPAKAAIVKLAELSMGKLKTKDVQAVFVSEVTKGGFDQDFAVIGTDLLLRYKVTIDYGLKEMFFEELPPLNGPTTNNNQNKPNNNFPGQNGGFGSPNPGFPRPGGIRPGG